METKDLNNCDSSGEGRRAIAGLVVGSECDQSLSAISQLRQIRGKLDHKPDDCSLSWLMGIRKRDHEDQCYLRALKNLTHLREIDLCYDKHTEEQVERLLHDRVPDLSAVHLEVRSTTFPEYLLRYRSDYGMGQRIRHAMVSLVFQDTLKMLNLLRILDFCENLEIFDAKKVLIDGSEPLQLDASLPWGFREAEETQAWGLVVWAPKRRKAL